MSLRDEALLSELLDALQGVIELAGRRRDREGSVISTDYISTTGPYFRRLEDAFRAWENR